MEIESLRFIATEDDLNELFARLVAPPPKVRDLRLRVIPDRLAVTGAYQTIFPIPFESLWELSVCAGKIAARLSDIKAGGVGTNFMKGYVLSAIGLKTNVFELRDETFSLDLDRFLLEMGVPLRTNLVSVRCERERLVIECERTRHA
ncbi:MAG: hypothetical protein ACREQ2_15565 [Candidatus Binatia bacterium]